MSSERPVEWWLKSATTGESNEVFLDVLELVAAAWLDKLDTLSLYEKGDVETAALANVLQRFLQRRRG